MCLKWNRFWSWFTMGGQAGYEADAPPFFDDGWSVPRRKCPVGLGRRRLHPAEAWSSCAKDAHCRWIAGDGVRDRSSPPRVLARRCSSWRRIPVIETTVSRQPIDDFWRVDGQASGRRLVAVGFPARRGWVGVYCVLDRAPVKSRSLFSDRTRNRCVVRRIHTRVLRHDIIRGRLSAAMTWRRKS